MLLKTFREHNKKYRELDKEYVKGTVLRYERTVRYLKEFLQKRFRTSDIPLQDLNNAFVRDFEHFIRVEKECAQNATVKYLKNLKKITNSKWKKHTGNSACSKHLSFAYILTPTRVKRRLWEEDVCADMK
jgi:ribosomal protein L31E